MESLIQFVSVDLCCHSASGEERKEGPWREGEGSGQRAWTHERSPPGKRHGKCHAFWSGQAGKECHAGQWAYYRLLHCPLSHSGIHILNSLMWVCGFWRDLSVGRRICRICKRQMYRCVVEQILTFVRFLLSSFTVGGWWLDWVLQTWQRRRTSRLDQFLHPVLWLQRFECHFSCDLIWARRE